MATDIRVRGIAYCKPEALAKQLKQCKTAWKVEQTVRNVGYYRSPASLAIAEHQDLAST